MAQLCKLSGGFLWLGKNTAGVLLSKPLNLVKLHSNTACSEAFTDHSILRLTHRFPFMCMFMCICLSSMGLRGPEVQEWCETILYCGPRPAHSANISWLNESREGPLSQGKGSINTVKELMLWAKLEKGDCPRIQHQASLRIMFAAGGRPSVFKELRIYLDYKKCSEKAF